MTGLNQLENPIQTSGITLNLYSDSLLECDKLFEYEGIKINNTLNDVDLFVFEGIMIPHSVDDVPLMLESLKKHISYLPAKENPQVPKLFTYLHELVDRKVYNNFIDIVSEELNTDKSKIILFDTCINHRENTIKHPLLNKFKQFFDIGPVYLSKKSEIFSRTKKFALLLNKPTNFRIEVFDKILSTYDGVSLLKGENFISFRNAKQPNEHSNENIPSNDLSEIESMIRVSREDESSYQMKYDFDFYKNLNLPWVLDNQDINDALIMYSKMIDIYSQSFYSIVVDGFEPSTFDDTQEYFSFSEKFLVPLLSGNLPYIVHDGRYYEELEKCGFDFSYIQSLFGIDYKNNTLKQNFDDLKKFILYFKNNSLETIERDYKNLKSVIERNKLIVNNLFINKVATKDELEFIDSIKQEKNKF